MKESAIVEGSDRALSFAGKPATTIGPGVVMFSDPVELNVPALADLAVSLYFPGRDRAADHARDGAAHHVHFERG